MTEPNRNPQDPARRRLARGALATPAVLASITAKDALAGNYHCSVSGKMSGNMSHKGAADGCRSPGYSCTVWKERCRSSSTKVRDCLGIDYKGKSTTTRGVTTHRRASPACGESGWTSATCDQLMNGSDYSSYPVDDIQLVYAAMCAYLNAQEFGKDYHITTADARGLFLGAIGQQSFQKNGKTWTSAQCREHLQLLYY